MNQQLQVATLAGDRHGHGRVAGRRHDDHDDRHQLHQGAADRNPERARRLGGDVPGARASRCTGYDVGGSHAGTQTGYVTYGVERAEHRRKIEGIDTTEGTDANAGYFDFGSFEEFQIGGAGNGAEQLRARRAR